MHISHIYLQYAFFLENFGANAKFFPRLQQFRNLQLNVSLAQESSICVQVLPGQVSILSKLSHGCLGNIWKYLIR